MSNIRKRGPPVVPAGSHRTLIQTGPPSTSEGASTTALKGMKTRRSDALSDPKSVLSNRSNHRQVIQKFDIEQPRTSSRLTKRPYVSDPEASPGRDRAALNPSKRGATIMAPSELVPETPPEDDHSSPISGWSRSAPQDSPTLGPAFEDEPQSQGSQGVSTNPIPVSSQGVEEEAIPEWDDHNVLEATLVNLDETGEEGYYTRAASPYEDSIIEEEDKTAREVSVPKGKGRSEAPPLARVINTHVSIANVSDADEPMAALPPRPRIPATAREVSVLKGKGRSEAPPLAQVINTRVSIANVSDANEPTAALPPRSRIPATDMALFSEYMGGSTLKPPTLSAATVADLCQSLRMGSAIANSHIALFELQVQLHILQSMLTTQEIKRQGLNLMLADRGRAPMSFQGFLPDPISRLDDVYSLLSARHKMKGSTLDPAKTVSIYGLVHHALSNREEHNIPAIVASGGLPLQSSDSFDQAQEQNDRYLNEVRGRGGQDADDNEYYDVQEAMDQMLDNQNPRGSPSRIPRRATIPTPVTTKRPDTAAAAVASSWTHASKPSSRAPSKPMAAAPSNAVSSGSRAVAHAAKPSSRPPSRPTAATPSNAVASGSRAVAHAAKPSSRAPSRPTVAAPSNAVASGSRTRNPAPPKTRKK